MCGRYATTRTATDLAAIFDVVSVPEEAIAVDYNVAPTDAVPVVRMSASAGGRVLSVARWGLIPPWASDPRIGARMINARAETVETARAYAKPFATRRCLIPATGWYEFAAPMGIAKGGTSRRKQPYFMTPYADEPVVFGGLWSVWGPSDARRITCTIVTTAAVGPLRGVHDRMPLILSPARWEAWLTATVDLHALLAPPSEADVAALEIRPVGSAVGDVRSDGPGLVEPIETNVAAPIDLTLF